MTLEPEEPRDHPNYTIAVLNAQAGAQGGIWHGSEEGVEGKTAEDSGVLAGLADPGREVAIPHGLGYDDEMVGATAGDSLCRT